MNCESYFESVFVLTIFSTVIDIFFILRLDDKYIENSSDRLKKIHEMEQQAVFLPQTEQCDAFRRLVELKRREMRFKEILEQKKCFDQIEADFRRATIDK